MARKSKTNRKIVKKTTRKMVKKTARKMVKKMNKKKIVKRILQISRKTNNLEVIGGAVILRFSMNAYVI